LSAIDAGAGVVPPVRLLVPIVITGSAENAIVPEK
jgi:hypothetical protein